jgi:hypothetical protein
MADGSEGEVMNRSRSTYAKDRPPPRNSKRSAPRGYAIAAWERPNRLPEALFDRPRAHFGEARIVELTLRITLCGFFNKFNDALQIEEEPEAAASLVAASHAGASARLGE